MLIWPKKGCNVAHQREGVDDEDDGTMMGRRREERVGSRFFCKEK